MADFRGPAQPGDLDQGGERDRAGTIAAVERQLPGAAAPADQQPATARQPGVDAGPGPVIPAVALGAPAGRIPLPRAAGQAARDRPGRAGARPGGHPVRGGHGQHIAHLAALQVGAQARVSAVHLIGGDPARGRARVQRPADHPPGQRRLGRERRPVRDARRAAPARIGGPRPRQVQLPVDQRVPGRRGVAEKYFDLAVLHPARRPGVLPLHAGAGRALLQVAGLIDHQHRIRAAKMLDHVSAHIVTDRPGIPPGRS